MVFLTEKGSFAKITTVDTQVISHSLGESPKILIFWTTAQIAAGFDPNYITSFGVTDAGAVDKAMSMVSEDGQTMSDTGRQFSSVRCIQILAPNGGLEARANISAVSATDFTVNWNVNGGGADIIHYMLFAGSDITEFEVDDFTANTVSGNQVIPHNNAPSGGYDIYMFITAAVDGISETNNAELGIGFATGPANEAAMAVVSEHNRATTDTHRFQKVDRCIVQLVPSTGAIDAEAEFVSKTTTDFTINWIDPPANADRIIYMGIKGGSHHVNNFTEPGVTGTQDITDAGFLPKGYILASYCRDAQTIVRPNNIISFGGTDGTLEGVLSARDQDFVGTTNAITNESTADVIRMIIFGLDIIGDKANHSAFLSNGFQINWTDIGEVGEIFYWTFGDAVGAAIVKVADEVLEHVDSGVSILGFNKIGSDVLEHFDSAIKVLGVVKIGSDILEHVDSALKIIGFVKIGNEVLEHIESAISKVELRRIANEILDHVETPVKVLALVRIADEILDHIETAISKVEIRKIANEVLEHIESAIQKITAAAITALFGRRSLDKPTTMDKG